MASDQLLIEWSSWMRAGGLSPRTITERVEFIRRFEGSIDCSSLHADWQSIAAFLGHPAFTQGTRQTYFSSLRAWYRWLAIFDHRIDDPTIKLKSPKSPRRQPRPLTITQVTRMLSIPAHHRTRAMILLGAYQGFRDFEIAKFRGNDITGVDIQVIGKGGVASTVPLHDLVAEFAVTMPDRGYWFPSRINDGPIQAKSVSAIISKVMTRAGIGGNLTPHSLRHFYGTECLRSSGGNLVVTKELMRHASVATTAGYTLIEDSARRAAIDALPRPVVSPLAAIRHAA